MRLRLRLLLVFIASLFRQRLRLDEENVLNLRVLPNDVDVTQVSDDRYLALMDLGRINSKVIYWDDEWAWTEHVFERNGRTTAIGLTKAMFKSRDGLVPVGKFIEASGQSLARPALPGVVAQLQTAEALLPRKADLRSARSYCQARLSTVFS